MNTNWVEIDCWRLTPSSEVLQPYREVALRLFANVRRLFHGLGHALKQPEVQGGAQLAISLVLIATLFYWFVEGWSLLDAVYFAVVTIATVGYGDLAPHTTIGKIFTIGYIVSGIGIFVAAITALAQATLHADRTRPEQSDRSSRQSKANSEARGLDDDANSHE
jgi:voltage-gated potassium channel